MTLSIDTKFMFTGHGGFYNRGCEAIIRSTVDLLRSRLPNAHFILYSNDYENDSRQIRDKKINLRPYPPSRFTTEWFVGRILEYFPNLASKLLNIIGSSYYKVDACLSVGGDNYTLDYGFPKSFIQNDKLRILSGIPLIIWGASIGPFESDQYTKSLMIKHLKSADLITARESLTIKYLKSLDITKNVVQVFDPAFSLQPEICSGQESAFMQSGDILGINISALIMKWRSDNNITLLIDEVSRFVDNMAMEGFKVILIPHVTRKTDDLTSNDESFLSMIMKQIKKHNDAVYLLQGKLNARQLKWIISKCRFFIGSRTHSTIAAISSGVPTISIAYSTKARGINKDIFGHEKYILETPLVSKDTLINKILLLQKNENIIRSLLKDKKSLMIHNAQKNVEALMDLLYK